MKTLVIHYNNPERLEATLENFRCSGISMKYLTVVDNGSKLSHKEKAKGLASSHGSRFIANPVNQGWGAAVNSFLRMSEYDQDDILLISAHDALFHTYNHEEVAQLFRNDLKAVFVCPQYPIPKTSYYSLAKGFYSKTEAAKDQVIIGVATALFCKPTLLKTLLFDEEFFIYGCEYEIFLRAHDSGLKTFMCKKTVVENPDTDSSSRFAETAYTINSLYYAGKRAGFPGFSFRCSRVFLSSLFMFLRGDVNRGMLRVKLLLFAMTNPGKGFRTYLSRMQ